MTIIDNVLGKCREIREQVKFIYDLAEQGQNSKWVENDPDYDNLKMVYNNAKIQLEALIAELP